MSGEIDWELVARLNLYEFLLEIVFANASSSGSGGQLRDQIVDRMVNRAQCSVRLSEEDQREWQLNARTVTERFFRRVEQRRLEIRQGA